MWNGWRARIADLDGKERSLLARFRRNAISESALDHELELLKRERDAVRLQLATAERALSSHAGAKARLHEALAFVDALRGRLAAPMISERREIVAALVDPGGVVFDPGGQLRVTLWLPLAGDGGLSRPDAGQESGARSGLQLRVVA